MAPRRLPAPGLPQIRKGDRFVQRHPAARWPVFVEVTRVSHDCCPRWVDIRCQTWAVSWGKRMPVGIDAMLEPGHEFFMEREDWTEEDVLNSAPRAGWGLVNDDG